LNIEKSINYAKPIINKTGWIQEKSKTDYRRHGFDLLFFELFNSKLI